jgi:hypothetical protein
LGSGILVVVGLSELLSVSVIVLGLRVVVEGVGSWLDQLGYVFRRVSFKGLWIDSWGEIVSAEFLSRHLLPQVVA